MMHGLPVAMAACMTPCMSVMSLMLKAPIAPAARGC